METEGRITRSRARATGSTTPIQMMKDTFKSATSLLKGKSKNKKETASDGPAAALFADVQVDDTQLSTQADQEMAIPASPLPAAAEVACVGESVQLDLQPAADPVSTSEPAVSAEPPMDPMPMSPMPHMQPSVQAEALPVPMSPIMHAQPTDDMAISPAPASMVSALNIAASPEPVAMFAQESFGTPIEAAVPVAMSPIPTPEPAAMEDSSVPQHPLQEFSFESVKMGEEEQEPAAVEPLMQAGEAAEVTTPIRVKAGLKTPMSAVVPSASARLATKPPLSAVKPTGIRTPAVRVPVVSPLKRPDQPAAKPSSSVKTPAPSSIQKKTPVKAGTPQVTPVVPTQAKPAAGTGSSMAKQGSKRVSICIPQTTSHTPSMPKAVATPYPKSGSKTPEVWAAEDMEEDEATQMDTPAAATTEDTASGAAINQPAAESHGDAAMMLAAELRSYRSTAEEHAVVAEVTAPGDELLLVPAAEVAAGTTQEELQPEDDGMDVDAAPPSAGPTFPAAAAAEEEEFTPEFMPLATSNLKSKGQRTPAAAPPTKLFATPKSAKYEPAHLQFQALAEGHKTATPVASAHKLTIPVSTASYMASTKSSVQKTHAPAAGPAAPSPAKASITAAATASFRPRVKSQVVGAAAADDKSMKQLKREIKAAIEAQVQDVPGLESDDEMGEAPYSKADEEMLVAAMNSKIAIDTSKRAVLKGMPLPLGSHIRFEDDGAAVPSPTSGKTILQGMPTPKGRHTRFD